MHTTVLGTFARLNSIVFFGGYQKRLGHFSEISIPKLSIKVANQSCHKYNYTTLHTPQMQNHTNNQYIDNCLLLVDVPGHQTAVVPVMHLTAVCSHWKQAYDNLEEQYNDLWSVESENEELRAENARLSQIVQEQSGTKNGPGSDTETASGSDSEYIDISDSETGSGSDTDIASGSDTDDA